MSKDIEKILEKMYGKLVTRARINLGHGQEPIPFDIYDGYATCENHNGHKYDILFPMMKIVKGSPAFEKAIMNYVGGIESEKAISSVHVMITFPTLYIDGIKVKEDDETFISRV